MISERSDSLLRPILVLAATLLSSTTILASHPEFDRTTPLPDPPLEPVSIPAEFLPKSGESFDKNGNPVYYQNAVRVLAYHDTRIHPFRPAAIDVAPDMLRDMLSALDRLGYNVISTRDLQDFIVDATANPVSPNAVVLTFDDFYIGNYDIAFPMLRDDFSMPATFFAHTAFVGGGGDYPKATWDNMREIVNDPSGLFLAQSHTVNHPNLSTLPVSGPGQTVTSELVNSRSRLASELARPLSEFEQICYPFGGYNANVITTARDVAGYSFGYTTIIGLNSASTPPFELRRDSIFIFDTLQTFLNKLGHTAGDPNGPIIIDNTSTGFTQIGFTIVSTGGNDHVQQHGNSYHRATTTTGSASASATWTAPLNRSGNWEVFAWWPGDRANSVIGANTGVSYTISQGSTLATPVIAQATADRSRWVSIGTYNFNAGNATVTVTNTAPAGSDSVFADAIKFEFVSAANSVSDWNDFAN